jgi:hypothetical protein
LTLLAQEGDTSSHVDRTHESHRWVVAQLLKEWALAGLV